MPTIGIIVVVFAFISTIGVTNVYGLTDLERATIENPRLVNAFGVPLTDNINVNQQIQISADITNHQTKSQNFVYLVQIKNESGIVISLGWISGQLTPNQELSPSLSWMPQKEGEFTAEVYVWEGLKNHSPLSEFKTLKVNVS